MHRLYAVLAAALLGPAAFAADLVQQAGPDGVEALKWVSRPVIVFADAPADPRFAQQVEMLEAGADALAERDVVVIVDTDPAAGSALRTAHRPRGFMLVLIGKDGQVKYRKPNTVPVRELVRLIDRMPLRQQEIEAARGGNGT